MLEMLIGQIEEKVGQVCWWRSEMVDRGFYIAVRDETVPRHRKWRVGIVMGFSTTMAAGESDDLAYEIVKVRDQETGVIYPIPNYFVTQEFHP